MTQEQVNKFDSSLKFVEKISRFSPVYKVKRDGEFFVFKAADKFLRCCAIYHELAGLKKAKNVKGITHLVEEYILPGIDVAILKEYVEGKDLVKIGKKLKSPSLREKLESTVNQLHDLGMAKLDISPRNVVLSPDESDIILVDLDIYTTNKIFTRFGKLKKGDMANLEDLFV